MLNKKSMFIVMSILQIPPIVKATEAHTGK